MLHFNCLCCMKTEDKPTGPPSKLGNLGDPYVIKLAQNAKAHAIYTPRAIELPIRAKVQDALKKIESMGVISRVEQPTQWCAGMVAIPKKNGKLRICVYLKNLNEAVQREAYPLPKVDEMLAQLSGATIFSKLDANSGFRQIPLSEEPRPLTIFISLSGCLWFNKSPFGISSTSKLFQKCMGMILNGLEGVVCLMDDVLVFGHTNYCRSWCKTDGCIQTDWRVRSNTEPWKVLIWTMLNWSCHWPRGHICRCNDRNGSTQKHHRIEKTPGSCESLRQIFT